LWIDPFLAIAPTENNVPATFINLLFQNDQYYLMKLQEIFPDRIIHLLLDQDDLFFLPDLSVVSAAGEEVTLAFAEDKAPENAALTFSLIQINKKVIATQQGPRNELTSAERSELEFVKKIVLEWQEKLVDYLLVLKQRLEMDACFLEIFHLSLALPYETESTALFVYFLQVLHQRKGSFGIGESSQLHKLMIDFCMIRNPMETWKFRQLLIKTGLVSVWNENDENQSDQFRGLQESLFSNGKEGSLVTKPKFWSCNKHDYSKVHLGAHSTQNNTNGTQLTETDKLHRDEDEDILDDVVFVPKNVAPVTTAATAFVPAAHVPPVNVDDRVVEISSDALRFAHNNRQKAYIYQLLQVRFNYDEYFKPPTSQSSTRAILNRAIESLADNLYASEFHFVMELIQNADDNEYEKDTIPSIEFYFQHSEGSRTILSVQNNEKGFHGNHVGGICTISGSTKVNKVGFIGQKGVGFKSVFSICDEPTLTSSFSLINFDLQDLLLILSLSQHPTSYTSQIPSSPPSTTANYFPLTIFQETSVSTH
jgi:hypothetical protein